jgi:hypothetical protein
MQSLYEELIGITGESFLRVSNQRIERSHPVAEWNVGAFGWLVVELHPAHLIKVMAELMPIDGTPRSEIGNCTKFSLDIYTRSFRRNEPQPNAWTVFSGRIIESYFSKDELSEWIFANATNAFNQESNKMDGTVS